MALQWMILTYVVAAEAAIAILLTLPSPKLLRNRFVSLVSLILQPALFIVPFAGFQLLGKFRNSSKWTRLQFTFPFRVSRSIRVIGAAGFIEYGFLIFFFRYILEEWTSFDVYFWGLYCCRERSIREICKFLILLCFCYLILWRNCCYLLCKSFSLRANQY